MFLLELLFAVIFSFIVLAGFVMAGSKGPWNNLALLFIVVLLVTWAGGIWLTPVGPPLFGGYWLPFLIMAVLFALLLLTIFPSKDKPAIHSPEEKLEREEPEEIAAIAALGITFWLFVCALGLIILIAYLL